MTEPIRLAKRLVELKQCSRREAELYVAGGWVSVDGVVVEEPQFMVSEQTVELHPDAKLTPLPPVSMLFHQPPDVEMTADAIRQMICAEARSSEDHSGIRPLKQHLMHFFFMTRPYIHCIPLQTLNFWHSVIKLLFDLHKSI